ncbi:MAG: hypothetical protein HQK51_04505 [Oligoflexia bacterium]|nr:hypothetical protein [Oligoflexia bacterium]
MKKIFIFFLFLLFLLFPYSFINSELIFAATTFNGESSVSGTAMTGSADVTSEIASTNSLSTPHKVFIPINNDSSSAISLDRQSNNEISPLPVYDENLYVRFKLYNSDTARKRYYFVAMRTSGDIYTAITDGDEITTSATGDTPTLVSVRLGQLTSTGQQTVHPNQASTATIKESQYIYIFSADSKPSPFNITTDYKDGVFFELKFSNAYDGTTAPTITSIGRQDSRLFINYAIDGISSELISSDNYFKTIALNYGGTAHEALNYQSAIALTASKTYSNSEPNLNVGILVSDLKNGQTYNVAVAIVNKYRFVSKVSASSAGTPIEVENFLKEQGCYLLSAGFKSDHYVLNYFRMIRDNYLFKFSLGKAFVNFYYSFAYDWAFVVYKNESLSFIVRTLAYTFYFILNYFFLIFSILFLCALIIIMYANFHSPKTKPSERGSETP